MQNIIANDNKPSLYTDSDFTFKPIRELTEVLWDYIYERDQGLVLTPAQDNVINALLSQIKELCDENLPKAENKA